MLTSHVLWFPSDGLEARAHVSSSSYQSNPYFLGSNYESIWMIMVPSPIYWTQLSRDNDFLCSVLIINGYPRFELFLLSINKGGWYMIIVA